MDQTDATTVKLGLMPPMTGVVGIYGGEISNAARIACDEVNAAGGVLGRPLELVIEDDGSLPETSVAAAEKLVSVHGCSAIIGNLLSNSRIAVAYRVAEPHRIPYLNFSFYEGSIHSHYFFHFAALPNQQIERMIPYMRNKFGKRMFFAGNNYEWPRGSIDSAKHALHRVGGEVLGEVYTQIGITVAEIDNLLDAVEDAAPDVFVPYFAGMDQILLLTRFTERGLKSRMAVVMGHYDELQASKLPAEVREGFYSSNTYFMTLDTPQNQACLSRLARLPGITGVWPHGNGIITNFGEGAYVCVKAFAQAANSANSLEPAALTKALSSICVDAPQGTVQMEPNIQHATVNTYLTRCNAEGEFEMVEKFGAIKPVIPDRYRHERVDNRATLEEDIRLQSRMLEQMFEAVMLVDTNSGVIVYANGGANRMFGYERGEMVGLPMARLNSTYVAGDEKDEGDITNIIARKGSWQGNIQNVRKNGALFWSHATVNAFTHPVYGEVWMSVHQDITAQKDSEEALRRSEERLQQVIAATNDGIWDWNVQTNETYLSPRWKEIFGYRDEELENTVSTFFDMIHPDHRDAVKRAVEGHFERQDPYRLETRMRHKDGSYRWILTRGEAMRDTRGHPIRMVGMIQDITERKDAATALEESEKRFRQLFNAGGDAIYVAELTPKGLGKILEVNDVACERLGYERDELLTMTPSDLSPPDSLPAGEERFQQQILKYGQATIERIHVTKNGHPIPVEVNIHSFLLDGRTAILGVARDITERKQAELSLIAAKNQAEAANSAKSEFLANMSHEIRTPMNAVIGLTRVVLDSHVRPEQEGYLRKVLTSSEELLSVLNDILDYSKIEAGRMEIERAPLRVEAMLRSVADLFSARLEEKGLDLYLDMAADMPVEVLGDALRLTQVLNNLVGNAIKFTEHGEVCISASATEDEAGLSLAFAVQDTGIGLDTEQIAHLFKPFTQGDSSVTRKYGGTGLGLSICKRLVKLMGGRLSVDGSPGKGAKFSFTVRVDRSAASAAASDLRQVDGLRVLLVDDQLTSRQILERWLLSRRLEVTTAASGSEALKCLEQAEQTGPAFDVVLLDWRMPDMAGIEVARSIRTTGKAHQPKLIMITPHFNSEALRAEADALDIDGLLPKPIVPSQLFDLLAAVCADAGLLDGKSAHAAPQPGPQKTGISAETESLPLELQALIESLLPYLRASEVPPDELVQKLQRMGDDGDVRRLGKLISNMHNYDHEGALSEALRILGSTRTGAPA